MANRARPPVRVAIVQHDALYRDLLRIGLGHSAGVEVTGAYADGADLVRAIASTRPEVAVLDIDPIGQNGVQLGLRLRRMVPELGIVLLVGDRETGLLASVPTHGLQQWSYLVNTAQQGVTALLRAIQVTHARLLNLSDIGPYRRADSEPLVTPLPKFTKRQTEILDLLARGFTNKVIADTLHLKEKTIENQLATVYDRIDPGSDRASVHPRVRAALRFIQGRAGESVAAGRDPVDRSAADHPQAVDERGEHVEQRDDGDQHER